VSHKGLRESQRAKELLEQRDVLALRASGWSWEDIAERLGVTEKTAKARWRAALTSVRAELEDLAVAVFVADLQLFGGMLEGLKSRVAVGEPIALEQMRKTIKDRRELFAPAKQEHNLTKPAAAAAGGGAAPGDDEPRVKLNFVRLGGARAGHKPGEEPEQPAPPAAEVTRGV
jgi:hypothetical protein